MQKRDIRFTSGAWDLYLHGLRALPSYLFDRFMNKLKQLSRNCLNGKYGDTLYLDMIYGKPFSFKYRRVDTWGQELCGRLLYLPGKKRWIIK